MSSWVNGNLQGRLSIGQGERGKSIECMWRGTELGIRQEGEEEYQFVDLAGSGTGGSGINIFAFEIEEDGSLYCSIPDENTGNITYSINKNGELEVEING